MALLDDVFVRSRGRRMSLADRFPRLVDRNGAATLFAAYDDSRVVAVVVGRRFSWLAGDDVWEGAMFGCVATSPAERGRGLASEVLSHAAESGRRAGADFGVLWTTIPGFYERLGWQGADTSLFAELEPAPRGGTDADRLPGRPLDAGTIERVERIRARFVRQRVLRTEADYATIPEPAERVEAIHDGDAYALVGRADDVTVLYELIGDVDRYPAIWSTVASTTRRVLVNGHAGSASHAWLEAAGVALRPQRLAMWLPLSPRAEDAPFGSWHIPFYDRI
jgi:GNAT superfamily N-acetyltransferase